MIKNQRRGGGGGGAGSKKQPDGVSHIGAWDTVGSLQPLQTADRSDPREKQRNAQIWLGHFWCTNFLGPKTPSHSKDTLPPPFLLSKVTSPHICASFRGIHAELTQRGARPKVLLAVLLLCEARDAQSHWKTYIAGLPKPPDVPFVWPDHQIAAALRGSPALAHSLKRKRRLERVLSDVVRPVLAAGPAGRDVGWPEFAWAMAMVYTRSFYLMDADAGAARLALVPGVDYLNHRPEADAACQCRALDTGDMEVVAVRGAEAGTELSFCYGPLGAYSLFTRCRPTPTPAGGLCAVGACVRACVSECACEWVRVRVRACARVCMCE